LSLRGAKYRRKHASTPDHSRHAIGNLRRRPDDGWKRVFDILHLMELDAHAATQLDKLGHFK
jgi:hypothetical protein